MNPSQSLISDESPRARLVDAIMTFLGAQDLLSRQEIRSALEHEIDQAGPDALVTLKARLASLGSDWEYYPPDPLARRIHAALADRFLLPDSTVLGIEHLADTADAPVVMMANHLSYADANLLEVLLRRGGGADLADRLTAIAGPKVFATRERRFSSLCFGTIKVPQSTGRSTDEAVMSAREVARGARRSIDAARHRLTQGDVLLVFAEGSRSRNRAMQPMLTGVTRYLDVPGTWILPAGIVGTDSLFPVGEDALHPVRAVVAIGRPFRASALAAQAHGDRRLMMDVVGLAIAALLPPSYRGVYGDDATDLDEARAVLGRVRGGRDFFPQI
jgi:1-acyl-sn-glycerol-3-phosphate acyltransferase